MSLLQNFQDLDIGILKAIFEGRNPFFDPILIAVTNTAAILAFGIPGMLLIVSLIRKNSVLRRDALLMLIPVAISAIVANILKYAIDLPRPYEIYPFIQKLSVGGSPSFPSGHTADAFAFAAAASLVYRKWLVVVPCFIWASFVGYTRMGLGVHFPSDVLGGALVGILTAIAYHWTNNRLRQNTVRPEL